MKETHSKTADAARSSSAANRPGTKPVERLFAFVLRSRGLIVGGRIFGAPEQTAFHPDTRDLSATDGRRS